MELNKANQILNSIRTSMKIDGYVVPPAVQTKGMLILFGAESADDNIKSISLSPHKTTASIFYRLCELKIKPPVRHFDIQSLCFLHKSIFSDIKQYSGMLRKINITKNSAAAIDFKMLPSSLRTMLTQVNSLEKSNLMLKSDFAIKLSHFFREMTILSPFLYGSGITVRTFFDMYANFHGFTLDYYKSGFKEFSESEEIAFLSDSVQPLYSCLMKSLFYMRPEKTDKTAMSNAPFLAPSQKKLPASAPSRMYPVSRTITLAKTYERTEERRTALMEAISRLPRATGKNRPRGLPPPRQKKEANITLAKNTKEITTAQNIVRSKTNNK